MTDWRASLHYDPIPVLLAGGSEALEYHVRRDLLDEPGGPVERLWELPEAQRILKKQEADGRWRRRGEHKHPATNPDLIETWRWLRVLVQQYGFTREHLQAERAAEYLFSCQTAEGDFRGVLANQYATYYSGAILATLVQLGYIGDRRADRAFDWLLAMRQEDGGWTIPMLTHQLSREEQYRITTRHVPPLEPDRGKPFSHNWTGMVLRAFAAHPRYRQSETALHAGRLLKSRFFQPDAYTSYQDSGYWLRFEFPFWWNNLVAALDTLFQIGFTAEDPDMARGLNWLRAHQELGGLWKLTYAHPEKEERDTPNIRGRQLWVGLAICRMFKLADADAPGLEE